MSTCPADGPTLTTQVMTSTLTTASSTGTTSSDTSSSTSGGTPSSGPEQHGMQTCILYTHGHLVRTSQFSQ